MIQPAASVNNVILLEYTKARSVWWSVGKDKDFPSFFRGMGLDSFFEPIQLSLIDSYFVRSVNGITEDSRSQSYEKRLIRNLMNKMGCWLSMSAKEHFQVGLVCIEFVNSFQVWILQYQKSNNNNTVRRQSIDGSKIVYKNLSSLHHSLAEVVLHVPWFPPTTS